MVVALLAACFVVFLPLAMAGWHLTRNKILFFSAVLFILLAAAVHILPFASTIFSSLHSYVLSTSTSCFHYLYSIHWHLTSSNSSSSSSPPQVSWTWSSSPCRFTKFSKDQALEFLSRSWIVVAGDSQARFFLVSLLQLLLENAQPVRATLFKYHSNFEHHLETQEIRTDFIWAPYPTNLTSYMTQLHKNGSYPDLIIMGAGLWHMLHLTDAPDYGASLSQLRDDSSSSPLPQHLFWLNLPELVPRLLNTPEKRSKMTHKLQSAYDSELLRSQLCSPGGPFQLLDVRKLSSSCGADCTSDGMHYSEAVYEALVQLMLHSLAVN